MRETGKFFNLGFGWTCRACGAGRGDAGSQRSRLFREGEAESKFVELSETAMARWADKERTILVCPKCGASERIAKKDE
ncbi:MAG TPA: hypothetical protein PKO33_04925 [Pyrinomonadaceae bacterium]|nr:hypothetical protein [Pyrinomonadaceae bacterium]